jgi:hypothetical protein
MKIACVHCGKSFAISAEQLGGKGHCPHCRGEIALPKASDQVPQERHRGDPHRWLDYSISTLTSMMLHMVVLLALVYLQSEGSNTAGPGDEVQIGLLPVQELAESPAEELQSESVAESESPSAIDEAFEVEPPVATSADASAQAELALAAPTIGGSDPAGFDLGSVGIGSAGGMSGGGSWDGMLQTLRRNGLDVVIVFDSTGSMGGEIDQVKDQVRRIGSTLLTLVPKARISLVTYRDHGDDYVAKGIPLTGDLRQIEYFLSGVEAGGGGDLPEAVDEGMKWALENNKFRPSARKVMLIFGDAPPHTSGQPGCLRMAKNFRDQQKGIVSTVTCRSGSPLREFYAIADAGGGEAFLTTDERQIVSQLMVLVFGSQHRDKVLEAFKLLEK